MNRWNTRLSLTLAAFLLLALPPASDAEWPAIYRLRRIRVESEAIRSIGYHHKTKTMEVQFHSGDTYRYANVPPAVFNAFLAADSKGRFFQEQIRGRYDYWKVATPRSHAR